MSVQGLLSWACPGKIEKDIDRAVLCVCETLELQPRLRALLSSRPLAQQPRVVAALDGNGLCFAQHIGAHSDRVQLNNARSAKKAPCARVGAIARLPGTKLACAEFHWVVEAMRMRSSSEIDDRADFFWKRALEVRARARTLSSPESKDALLKTADEYERIAEALTHAVLHDEPKPDTASPFTTH